MLWYAVEKKFYWKEGKRETPTRSFSKGGCIMQVLKFKVKRGRNPKHERQIITLSLSKSTRIINLYKKYKQIGFKDFNLIDLAEMSLKQWKLRKYPVPNGYILDWNHILVPETLRSKLFHW